MCETIERASAEYCKGIVEKENLCKQSSTFAALRQYRARDARSFLGYAQGHNEMQVLRISRGAEYGGMHAVCDVCLDGVAVHMAE